MTTEKWLGGCGISRLDAELLLVYVLRKPREWVLAYTEYELSEKILQQLNSLATEVLQNTPLAYILRYKEFYGRKFVVTPDVLIPRPETEQLVELALSLRSSSSFSNWGWRSNPGGDKTNLDRHVANAPRDDTLRVLDIGTGSGCIGITLKLEHPELDVTLSDISKKALEVAKENSDQLGADVEIIRSDLISDIRSDLYDLTVANLPYVDKTWQISESTKYEPATALFASDGGLELIKKLIRQAPDHLTTNGHLALEADPRQHREIIKFATGHGFQHIKTDGFAILFQRNK